MPQQILITDLEKRKALAQVELIRQAVEQFLSEELKANPPADQENQPGDSLSFQ